MHCLLLAGWWPPQFAHLRTTVLPALISLKHLSESWVPAQNAHMGVLALHWNFWWPCFWHLVHLLDLVVISAGLKCLFFTIMESIFAVLWMTAVHVLLSGAHITLHLATLGSWAKSNGVSFQFSPVMVNFWVLTLWPPTMLRVIVSSEVPYLSGHLRAFAAIWLLGTIICLPLVMVLMEIALGFCLNQLWWHITAWKKCCALSPFTSRAGGIKNAGNWCFFVLSLVLLPWVPAVLCP